MQKWVIKITVYEKFEEAQFFLEKMKEPLTAIQIRHYYSAFLTAISSIFDHMLEDANNKFLLGIPLDERLNSRYFRNISQYLGNIKAKKFIDWYDDVFNLIRQKESGKIFHIERNQNVHRRIETPTLFACFETGENMKDDFIVTIQFVANMSKKEAEKYYEKQSLEYYIKINKNREKNNEPKCTSIITSFHFSLGGNHTVNLTEACEDFLSDIEDYLVNPYDKEFYLHRQKKSR